MPTTPAAVATPLEISATSGASVSFGVGAPPPPPPPAPTITLSSDGAAVAGTAEAITVTAANLTGPLTVTMESVSGPGVSWSPTTVAPAPGELVKLSMATWAAAGTAQVRGTAPGGIVSNTLTVAVSAAPPPPPPSSPFSVQTDANWTWFNKPEAARVGDLLYAGSVNSAGGIRVTQRHLDTAASNTFQLSAGFGSDDHNNASVIDCGGGRIAAFYAAHPDEFIRMRVQTTPGDNTAWSAQQNIEFGSGGLTDYYYPCPVILSQDPTQHFLFFRWRNGSGGFDLAYAVSSNFAAGPATFGSGIRLATNGPQRPYWSMFSNGVDRVDFLLSEGNPGEITGGVWHFYAKLDGSNVLRFYTTNGTEISGALPHSITTKCTKVNDTSDRKHWVWDVTTGTDGQPWALFVRFAANAGTDHRYHFARWNGSAWTHAEFTAAGGFLYSGEPFYSQGMHFSRVSPTRIYAGVPVSSVQQISTWAVGSGTSVSKVRDVTTGDAGTRARPVSPYNADSRCEALWWEGTYTSYTSYSTDVKGIAA
jgi:hypothetical protein